MVNKTIKKYYNVGIIYLNRDVYGVAAYRFGPEWKFKELEVEVPEFIDFHREYPELDNIKWGFSPYSDVQLVIEYTAIFEAAYKKAYETAMKNKDWHSLRHLEDKENWILTTSEDYPPEDSPKSPSLND